jgi:flavin-dependent dehydrogenase
MQKPEYDALIIGGGPAGSTAGAYLARAGLRVLIVEKERFPRFHIGESIMPVTNSILREIGVWDKVERAGFQPKYGAEFHVGNRSVLPKHVEFSKGLVPGLDYTYQVERSRFDLLLLDHARELGCEVRQETRASAVEPLGRDGYQVALAAAAAGGSAPGEAVRCQFLIDASGRDTLFAKPIKTAPVNPAFAKRVAIYAHFRGVPRNPGKAAGNIVIVRHGDGWFWIIPLSPEHTSVGVVTTTERMKTSRLKPAALFEQLVAESAKLAQVMEHAEPITPFVATADYNYRARRFATSRLVLVGDAACFLDPMFSTGVFVALLSAKLAAEEVVCAQRAGRGLSWWQQRRYTRRLGANLAVLEKLVKAFYDNAAFSVFMERNAPWRMAPAINSIVAGHSDPPWPVRWRYWLFLLVCRIQRLRPLVPPINFDPAPKTETSASAANLAETPAAKLSDPPKVGMALRAGP